MARLRQLPDPPLARNSKVHGKILVCIVTPDSLTTKLIQQVISRTPNCNIVRVSELSACRTTAFEGAEHIVTIVEQSGVFASNMIKWSLCRLPHGLPLCVGEYSIEEMAALLPVGARGFISYSKINKELIGALRCLATDHLWVVQDVLEYFVLKAQHKARRGKAALSVRQAQIVNLLQQRLSNKEISAALGISENTVKFHLTKIFGKSGIHDRDIIGDQRFALNQTA